MAKIYKLCNDADYYYNKGVGYCERGNYVDAIDCFHTALERDPEDCEIFGELGYAYMQLKLHIPALEMFYQLMAHRPKMDMGFIGAIQCSLELGYGNLAAFYYAQGLKTGALTVAFSAELDRLAAHMEWVSGGVFGDNVEGEEIKSLGLRVKDSPTTSDSIGMADDLRQSGHYDMALDIYNTVPEDSPEYYKALTGIGEVSLMQREFNDALEKFEEALELKPDYVSALVDAMLACHRAGYRDREEEFSRRINEIEKLYAFQVRDVAQTYMLCDNDAMSLKYFEILLKKLPYDREAMVGLAQTQYNMDRKSEAAETILTARKLYPYNPVVRYYARLLKTTTAKKLSVDILIPASVVNKRYDDLTELIKQCDSGDTIAAMAAEDEELRENIMWMLQTYEDEYATRLGVLLCENAEWRKIIFSLLTCITAGTECKKEWVVAYLKYERPKYLAVSQEELFIMTLPNLPKCDDDTPETREGYWRVFIAMAYLRLGHEKKLAGEYRKLIRILNDPETHVDKVDPRAFASVLAYMVKGCGDFEDPETVYHLFGSSEEAFMELANAMDIEYDFDEFPIPDLSGLHLFDDASTMDEALDTLKKVVTGEIQIDWPKGPRENTGRSHKSTRKRGRKPSAKKESKKNKENKDNKDDPDGGKKDE